MNNKLKRLILKIVALSSADQQWIMGKLTADQQKKFEQYQGKELLDQAQRFRKLTCPKTITIEHEVQLPALCQHLMQQEPLFIAIILEQGEFHWKQQFLNSLTNGNEIQQLIYDQVSSLKPITRLATFKIWQDQLDFDDQLVIPHG